MYSLPFMPTYWVIPGKLMAGQYPGHFDPMLAAERIRGLVDCGIRQVINLMEADEVNSMGQPFVPYIEEMRALAAEQSDGVGWSRYPIRDGGIPDRSTMRAILDEIDGALAAGKPVYVHCWGGKGRTGTVIGCYLIRHSIARQDNVLAQIKSLRQNIHPYHDSPENDLQRQFVLSWVSDL